MAAPQYVVRSYGGAAVVAQLVENMGASDLSFVVAPTTGWVETQGPNIGSPLGTSGDFVVVIDRFTNTVEKILCSSVNLTTGVVQVATWSGGNGRGYDGSTAQGHVPGGSQSGAQNSWSAEEAFEANQVVAYVLGTLGGTPSNGQVLTWESGAPQWHAVGSLGGNPAGRMYNTGGGTIASGTPLQITTVVDGTPNGGVTFASNALTVPTTGWYRLNWSVGYNSSGSFVGQGYYDAYVEQNGGQIRLTSQGVPGSTAEPVVAGSDLIHAAANDVFTLWAQQGSGLTQGISSGTQNTFLSLSLESTP